jgi:NADH-quinone oxidoreductase subunit G
VIAELARRAGLDTGVETSAMAFAQLVDAVPFYRGLSLEEIGGRGLRWPEREAASALPASDVDVAPAAGAPERVEHTGNGSFRLGTYRPIWAAPEVEISPALNFTVAHQQVELAPEDALRLGITDGDAIEVAQNGTKLRGSARVRFGVPAGTAFLAEGIATRSANVFTEPLVEVHKQ